MGMPYKVDTPDAAVARIATEQHGVVTAKQLAEVGLGRMAISERARSGRLHRLHRGVYAVGHRAPSWHGRWTAAVLACGEGAVLSHHSAAALWELLKPIDGSIHVSTPSTSGRAAHRGIHLHRCPSLSTSQEPSPSPSYPDREGGRGRRLLTTHRHNIPTTTIQRTIDDLRASSLLPPHLLRRAIRQAEHKGHHLEGVKSDRTRSDLETAFLPPGSISFEDDYARDLDLRSAGYNVLRFNDVQLEEERERVAADIAAALTVSSTSRG